jgi:uncharacterized hydrophobic protein (TIGR00271 family)
MVKVLFDVKRQDEFAEKVQPALVDVPHECIAFDAQINPADYAGQTVLTWLGDQSLSTLLPMAAKHHWVLGFLPHPDMQWFYRSFPLATTLIEALDDFKRAQQTVAADLMLCNGQPVLSSVMLGQQALMHSAAKVDVGWWSKLFNVLVLAKNVRQAHLSLYTLRTAKEVEVKTAALGIAVVYRPGASDFTRRVVGETLQDHASSHTVILAPRSMTEVLHFFFTKVLPKQGRFTQLPSYAGHIKTQTITINSSYPIQYTLDGDAHEADSLCVTVQENALTVRTTLLPQKSTEPTVNELIQVAKLPKGQATVELCGRALPWIYHADKEELKDTFVGLKESAVLSESFVVLMILASVLATIGLFANSAPVIIGAMILAPLMSPIISLAMGVLRQSRELIVESAKTLWIGVALALFFGVLLTLMMPLHDLNAEITARLSPTILDLGVAIVAGIAGAYASARSQVAKSLAGVAIAVALVPPLAASAIGIGWLDWSVFWGAFLLFLTNLIGMVLAAAAAFLVMGFSPFKVAKKGLLLILPLVVLVSIPLVISFNSMVKEKKIVNQLEGWHYQDVVLRDVKIRIDEPLFISAKLLVVTPLNRAQLEVIKNQVEITLGEPVQFETLQAVVID